jgi:hypothetical protein
MFPRGIPGTKGLGHNSGTIKIGKYADHGRVPVFSVVDPSETFSRDTEPFKLPLTYGSGVSEGSTTEKIGQGNSMNHGKMPLLSRITSAHYDAHDPHSSYP